MSLFGIADLHLSSDHTKPMDVFGDHWRDHMTRMAQAWDATVADEDIVLCPGDLSWALRLEDAQADLAWIAARPGRKILCRGNHDYWWSGISKVRSALPSGCFALQNDAIRCGDLVIAGSRLWSLPGSPEFGRDDDKIYKREITRLEMSLRAAHKLADSSSRIVAAVHFPPFTADGTASAFSETIENYEVNLCVYGHLHGDQAHRSAVEGTRGTVNYALVACDAIGFSPRRLDALLQPCTP
jgi:hypothetical protein